MCGTIRDSNRLEHSTGFRCMYKSLNFCIDFWISSSSAVRLQETIKAVSQCNDQAEHTLPFQVTFPNSSTSGLWKRICLFLSENNRALHLQSSLIAPGMACKGHIVPNVESSLRKGPDQLFVTFPVCFKGSWRQAGSLGMNLDPLGIPRSWNLISFLKSERDEKDLVGVLKNNMCKLHNSSWFK